MNVRMGFRRAALAVLGAGLGLWLGCDAEDSCDGDEPARLRIVNMTGNAFDEILIYACDGSDANSIPLPPPGLRDGDEYVVELPAPGCWIADYRGEGCESDPDFKTPHDVCSGETVTWEVDLSMHGCQG